tara:strand:- start:155 stop:358 length:204 start_codon:yes stop_codon:yes gene_type:complete
MGAPYKMKYTNGKKADAAAFPFKPSPGKQMAAPEATSDPKMQEAMQKKISEVVTKKVDEAVGGETNI